MGRLHKGALPAGALLIAAIAFGAPLSSPRTAGSVPAEPISFSVAQESSRTAKWVYTTGNTIFAAPVIGNDGTIYVSSSDSFLYALTERGERRWRYRIGPLKHVTFIKSTPAVGEDGTVYVGSTDRNLYAISPAGELKWRFEAGREVLSSPVLGKDRTIYFGSEDGFFMPSIRRES